MEDIDDIDEEGEAIIRVICSYLSSALEGALEELDEKEDTGSDTDWIEIARRHVSKKMDYLQNEGWIDGYEDVSVEDIEQGGF